VIWPLAWLYTNQHPENHYYHDKTILDLAMAGGDGLRNAQEPDGRWEFVKIDGAASQEQACGRIGFDLTSAAPRNEILVTLK